MFSGSTILGDGHVIMIVDPNGLSQSVASSVDASLVDTIADADARNEAEGEKISLLLFRAGSEEPKAVPLSLVTRLEEFEVAKIEHANGRPILLYRGSLIPLIYVNDSVQRRNGGTQPMLVFSDNGRTMGLVVDEIVDIVEAHLDLQLASDIPGFLGAAIIGERSAEILDLGHFLSIAFRDWFDRKKPQRADSSGRLLFVDDSAFFRGLLEPALRGLGYDVTACASGAEALERIDAGTSFDVIVSDIDMPEMDGFAFAEAIRNGRGMDRIPIIALSGLCTPDAVTRGRAVGFNDYIAKFDRAGLIAALREFSGQAYGEAA
jgi:two-component system chemotaxis sensor kinase CheA